MGGWMSYRRMRERNGLMERHPAYPPHDPQRPYWSLLVGDMNRMERDYLQPTTRRQEYEHPGFTLGDPSPLHQVAEQSGVDIETCRKVLMALFYERRPQDDLHPNRDQYVPPESW